MKIFILISFCLVTFMSITILAGIRTAHTGMEELTGQRGAMLPFNYTFQAPISIGNDSISHNLKAKQQKLEEMNAFNLFSFLGNEVSEGISKASNKLITFVANILNDSSRDADFSNNCCVQVGRSCPLSHF